MTVIKVCGVTDIASGRAAAIAGADLLGFHFCPSKRRITPELAESVIAALPRRPRLVGVFIDENEAMVGEVTRRLGLDYVQLHGSESPGFVAPCPIIKSLKVRDGSLPDAAGWGDPILLDSWSATAQGGTGRRWEWESARGLISQRRVLVAGGLNAANVGTLVREHRPYGVDVSSGVEVSSGIKDAHLLASFVQAVKRADAES
ncbi:MAG: phosphoribosylanthranilate isomerase [Candidatus Dormibacteraceae bacterium]